MTLKPKLQVDRRTALLVGATALIMFNLGHCDLVPLGCVRVSRKPVEPRVTTIAGPTPEASITAGVLKNA